MMKIAMIDQMMVKDVIGAVNQGNKIGCFVMEATEQRLLLVNYVGMTELILEKIAMTGILMMKEDAKKTVQGHYLALTVILSGMVGIGFIGLDAILSAGTE